MRLHVDANNFDESHVPRCLCQEPESSSIELNSNTFNRVYAHPKRGEDLFESIAARLESFGGGLRLERADIRLRSVGVAWGLSLSVGGGKVEVCLRTTNRLMRLRDGFWINNGRPTTNL